MSEPKDPNQDKTPAAGNRAPRKEVELFPVSERRPVAPGEAPTRGVTRLGTQISIFNPTTFEEALEIVECLRGRAATTISLDKMRKADAGRLVDFVTGASAALDGDFHKLTEQVYVFCPANIRIVSQEEPIATKSGVNAFDFMFSPDILSDKGQGLRQ